MYAPAAIRADRVGGRPIVTEQMLAGEDRASINGPSLMRVPAWVQHPLGRYYLYFAHHAGKYLRLAYADRLEGPWKIYTPGVQPLSEQTALTGHLASPDAVVDEANHRIYLFYHGVSPKRATLSKTADDPDPEGGQVTSVSVSPDGIHFQPLNTIVGPAYLRVFQYAGRWFAINHTGWLRSCRSLGEPFEPIARVIGDDIIAAVDPARLAEPGATPADSRPKSGPLRYAMRHVAVDVEGDHLVVFFTCVGHRPERILATVVPMTGAPESWTARGTIEVLRPETVAEGADLPLAYSRGGISRTRVRELRDPTVFRDGDEACLVYAVAGEHGLALARLNYASPPERR